MSIDATTVLKALVYGSIFTIIVGPIFTAIVLIVRLFE